MGREGVVAGPAAEGSKSQPECINSSNPYHECSDYCLRKIAEARQRLDDELPDSSKRPPEQHTVHLDCINASNPYHECSDYCFRRIADAKSGLSVGRDSHQLMWQPLLARLMPWCSSELKITMLTNRKVQAWMMATRR